jgi:hypothetical protein
MEHIIPWIQLGATATLTLFIIFQNRILRTQVAKQNEIINNMKAYADIIKLDEIKKYVEMREQTIKDLTEKEKRELEQEFFSIKSKLENEVQKKGAESSTLEDMFIETLAFSARYVIKFVPDTEQKRKTFIANAFPLSKEFFYLVLEKYSKHLGE